MPAIKDGGEVGISAREAARLYGLDENTIRRLARRNQLPGARKIGGRLIIHAPTLEDWLKSGSGK